jgi:hypothetical protein
MPHAAETILGFPNFIVVFAHDFQSFVTQSPLFYTFYCASRQE